MSRKISASLCAGFIAFLSLLDGLSGQSLIRGPYLQLSTPNSIVIRWRTDQPTNSVVRFGSAPGSLDQTVEDPSPTTEHEVQVTGLSPDTRYYYSVGYDTQILAGDDSAHFFITAPVPGTARPLRIWILGDSGTKNDNARAVRDAYYNFTGTRHTDLWLMLGDNAYNNGTDEQYQLAVFENMYEQMLIKSALWPALGNHDANTSSTPGPNPFHDIFTLPTNGEAGGLPSGNESYYSFDYGNVHFVCLNSNPGSHLNPGGAMLTWLEEDLAATTQDWIIAYWHHPPYSKGSHNSDSESPLINMRERVLPILEEAGVDLVLSGHSHSYERSFLIDEHYGSSSTLVDSMIIDGGDGRPDGDGAYFKPTLGPAPHEGAVYLVCGSSGKTSGGSLDHPVMVFSFNELGSMVLDIDGNRMDAVFLDASGNTLDYFTLVKGALGTGPATQLIMISGNNQTGNINETLPQPFVVEARDDANLPVAGVEVTFAVVSGEGTLSEEQPVVTGTNGRAATFLTFGSTPGEVVVTATADGLAGSPQTFTATAIVPPPDIDVTPASHNFGDVPVGSSAEQTFTVRNLDTGVLEVTDVSITGENPADFEITSGGGAFTLAENESRDVVVRFTPSTADPQTANLTFTSNDPDENPLDVPLSGNQPLPPCDPNVNIAVGQTTTASSIAGYPPENATDGNPNSRWRSENLSADNQTQWLKIDFGENVAIERVVLRWKSSRRATAYQIQTSNDDVTWNTIYSTTGASGSLDEITGLNAITQFLRLLMTESNDTRYVLNEFEVYCPTGPPPPPEPDIAVQPTSHDYGQVLIGESASQTFVVSNAGTGALNVTNVTLGGPDAGEFQITRNGAPFSLAPGDTHHVKIAFAPTTEGAKNATLTLASDDPDENPLDVPLAGTGSTTPPPGTEVVFTPSHDTFVKSSAPNKKYGTSRELRVRSSGSTLLYIFVKFEVTGISGSVQSAKIRLTVTDGSDDGGSIYVAPNTLDDGTTPWTESNLVWNNAPAIGGSALSSVGAVAAGTEVEFDVTSALTGNGTFSFAIKNTSSDRAVYGSKESNTVPKLVVTTGTAALQARAMLPVQPEGVQTEVKPPPVQQSELPLPQEFRLLQNYPNPFNPTTTIVFALPRAAHVQLRLYTLTGRLVRVLAAGSRAPGWHQVSWDGTDAQDQPVASGIYVYRLTAGTFSAARKLVLTR